MTRKIFIIIFPLIISVVIISSVFIYYQSKYNQILFERQIPINNLCSSKLKEFFSIAGITTCRCIITSAHPHRPYYSIYIMAETNNSGKIRELECDLIKTQHSNQHNIANLQKLGLLNEKASVVEYILGDAKDILYIYMYEQKIIICFPILVKMSLNETIQYIFNEIENKKSISGSYLNESLV